MAENHCLKSTFYCGLYFLAILYLFLSTNRINHTVINLLKLMVSKHRWAQHSRAFDFRNSFKRWRIMGLFISFILLGKVQWSQSHSQRIKFWQINLWVFMWPGQSYPWIAGPISLFYWLDLTKLTSFTLTPLFMLYTLG